MDSQSTAHVALAGVDGDEFHHGENAGREASNAAPEMTDGNRKKPKISTVTFTLTSINPMLQHAMTDAVMDNLPGGTGSIEKPNQDEMDVRQRAALSLYRGPNQELGIPAKCLFAALCAAGPFVKAGGRRNISNAEESMVPAFLIMRQRFLPFTNQDDASWEVNIDSTRNPTTKGRTCTIRPLFSEWEIRSTVEFNHAIGVTTEQLRQLFFEAGYRCGFGANRSKAPFGRFEVTSWDVQVKTYA